MCYFGAKAATAPRWDPTTLHCYYFFPINQNISFCFYLAGMVTEESNVIFSFCPLGGILFVTVSFNRFFKNLCLFKSLWDKLFFRFLLGLLQVTWACALWLTLIWGDFQASCLVRFKFLHSFLLCPLVSLCVYFISCGFPHFLDILSFVVTLQLLRLLISYPQAWVSFLTHFKLLCPSEGSPSFQPQRLAL